MNRSTAALNVIHENDDLLVVRKPAGLVCHPTKKDAWSSLIGRVRLYLGKDHEAHMINRLDRETSGVVIVAKDLRAARMLRAAFASRAVKKRYLGIAHGWIERDTQLIDAPLGKDIHSKIGIKDCVRADGASSMTQLVVKRRLVMDGARYSFLRIEPRTGRKHQIRIHLAHIGHPLVGDKLYGKNENYYLDFVEGRLSESARRNLITPCHALHCESIEVPVNEKETMVFRAQPEDWLMDFLGKADPEPR